MAQVSTKPMKARPKRVYGVSDMPARTAPAMSGKPTMPDRAGKMPGQQAAGDKAEAEGDQQVGKQAAPDDRLWIMAGGGAHAHGPAHDGDGGHDGEHQGDDDEGHLAIRQWPGTMMPRWLMKVLNGSS